MTIALSINKQIHLVPLRFERATTSAPHIDFPIIDNRGFNNRIADTGNLSTSDVLGCSALSLAENAIVTIKLVRTNIAPTAPLFLSSSDTQTLCILSPQATAKCADGESTLVKFQSLSCSEESKECDVNIHFGQPDGPIIGRLRVIVFRKLHVKVQPFLVNISSKTGQSGINSKAPLNSALDMAKAIWYHCGIDLSYAKPIALSANLQKANLLSSNELNELTNLKWEADRINLYIVEEIENARCYSVNAQEYKHLGLSHPGIFYGLSSKDESRANDIHLVANEIAHAFGSFFSLNEVSTGESQQNLWSMSSLMYAQSVISRGTAPSPTWQDYNQFGFGLKTPNEGYRGAFIPLKSITQDGTNSACNTARKFISKGAKHLYS